MANEHLCDEKSYQLAEYFLDGEEHTKADIADLAYVIQSAVENWFTGREESKDK
jgi:hypothetical protein